MRVWGYFGDSSAKCETTTKLIAKLSTVDFVELHVVNLSPNTTTSLVPEAWSAFTVHHTNAKPNPTAISIFLVDPEETPQFFDRTARSNPSEWQQSFGFRV